MCLYVLSSLLWWPVRFHINTTLGSPLPPVVCHDVRLSFTSSCLSRHSVILYRQLFFTTFDYPLPPVVCHDVRLSFTSSCLSRRSVILYLQLFVVVLVSYLRYLCLLACRDVQHILCCVFVLFFLAMCTICYQFLWIVHFNCPFGIL